MAAEPILVVTEILLEVLRNEYGARDQLERVLNDFASWPGASRITYNRVTSKNTLDTTAYFSYQNLSDNERSVLEEYEPEAAPTPSTTTSSRQQQYNKKQFFFK